MCYYFILTVGYSSPAGPILLYTTKNDIRIKNSTQSSKVVTIVLNLQDGYAVDFYSEGQLVCWTDQVLEAIQCVTYNGTYTGEKVFYCVIYNLKTNLHEIFINILLYFISVQYANIIKDCLFLVCNL